MSKKPRILNFFGGPGSGKSTAAAYIFSKLKLAGYNVELVTETAKDLTWDNAQNMLKDQIYVFGEQEHRFFRCADKVDLVITDSPLLLTTFYNSDSDIHENLYALVKDVIKRYDNLNVFLARVKPYNPVGRNQTESESDLISMRIQDALEEDNIPYYTVNGDEQGYEAVLGWVLHWIKEK